MSDAYRRKRDMMAVVLLMLFAFFLYRFDGVMDLVRKLMGICSPLVMGVVFALLVSQPLSFLERNLVFFNGNMLLRRLKRPLCLTMAMLFVLALVVLVVWVILPEVIAVVEKIIAILPEAIKQAEDGLNKLSNLLRTNLDLSAPDAGEIRKQVEQFSQYLIGGLNYSSTLILSAAGLVMNFFVGAVFAIYLLYNKEKLSMQLSRLMETYLKPQTNKKLKRVLQITVQTFSEFVSGQIMQAIISAIMTGAVMAIFGFPYALLVALMVFITSFIPVFGPFIAGAVGMLLVFSKAASMVWWFLLAFFVVQQVAGSLVYPRIMSNAIAMPPIWVLVSVVIGGGVMGLLGMMFFIPMTAVLYNLLRLDIQSRAATSKG